MMKVPRVLIRVRGGVAEFVSDGMVRVELVDFDNEPNAPIPTGFEDMVFKPDRWGVCND